MKYDVKICLPAYKICYACLYLILLSLVKGIAYWEEIGAVLDISVSSGSAQLIGGVYHFSDCIPVM